MSRKSDSYQRTVRRTGFVLIAILLILLLSAMLFINRHTFSSVKWKNSPETRNHIVADLLEKYHLEGMSEQDVVILLGNEDINGSQQATFKGDWTYYPPESTLVYYLGQDLLDDEWLILSLDNGIVQKVSFGIT